MSSAGTNEGGHYGRVFSLSFSPPFIDDDDSFDDDYVEDEEEEVNAQQNPLTEMRTTPPPKKKMKKRRRKRFLATSGEDDCVRLWVVHASSSSSSEEQRSALKVEPKPFGLSVLRGHSDAVLKCAFGLSHTFDDDDDDDEKCEKEEGKISSSSFALATGSSNGEVFVWRVVTTASGSGKGKGENERGDRLMAKFNANRKRAKEGISNEDEVEDADGKDDKDNEDDNNEVYGLKFLGGKDEYLVIATDAELIGVEVTRRSLNEKNGKSSVELKEIARTPLGFSLNESAGDGGGGQGKFDIAYAFAMDAYATRSRSRVDTDTMGNKHILSVGYSNGTMRMYCFDAKAREFYLVGENASVFDDNNGTGRKNMACTSLTFVYPAVENELEQFPNVVMCNRFGDLVMSDAKNWIERTKPRLNVQTDFALTHAVADVGNGFVACCGRMKERNVNGVALFDAFDVQRGSMFLNASEMMGEHASKYPLLCVGGFAEDVEEEEEEMVEDSTRRTRITVVAAGGMPAKLVNENFSNRSNAKSLGFSLAKMKVGGKRDGEEENAKTSRVYAWDFIT